MYELRYKYLWVGLGLLLVGLIAATSLMPASKVPELYANDKVFHFFAYFVVCCWFVGLIKSRFYILLGTLLFSFSFVIEILQKYMTRFRQFEWYDLLANGLGILSAVILGFLFLKGWCLVVERKFLKKPPI